MNLAVLVVVLAVLAVVLIAAVVGLVVTSTRRRTPPVPPPSPAPEATAAPVEAPSAVAPTPVLEKPEGAAGRLVRLRQRLAGSQGTLGRGLLSLLSRDRLDEDTWEDIEDTLITADVGVGPTGELVERLRTRLRVEGGSTSDVRSVLREELLTLVDPSMDRSLHLDGEHPAVVLVV